MGLLSVRAFAHGLSRSKEWSVIFWGVLAALAYAASDEIHQSFVPGRVASVQDFAADGLGILTSVGLLLLFWRLRTHVVADEIDR